MAWTLVLDIAPHQTLRLLHHAPEPLEADLLHPARRSLVDAGNEVEQTAAGLDPTDAAQSLAIADREILLMRTTQGEPYHICFGLHDISADLFLVFDGEIAVMATDPVDVRVQSLRGFEGFAVHLLPAAEQVESEAFGLPGSSGIVKRNPLSAPAPGEDDR